MRYFRLKEDISETFHSGKSIVIQSRFTVIESDEEPLSKDNYKEISLEQSYVCNVLNNNISLFNDLKNEQSLFFNNVAKEVEEFVKRLEKLV